MMESRSLAHIAMMAFSFLVAGSYSIGGQISTLVDPLALMTIRFGLAVVLIGLIAVASVRFDAAFVQAPWRYLALGGLLATFFALMFIALQSATPLSTSAVFTMTPFLSALFGGLILRQIPSAKVLLVLGIGAIGALWIIFEGNPVAIFALGIGRGEAIFFAGCVAYALYVPLAAWLNRGEPTAYVALFATISGFIFLLTLSGPRIAATDWTTLPFIVWSGLAYITIGATVLTFLLIQFAALNLDSLNVMSYTFLTPGWVLLWELALTGDLPNSQTLVGVVITVAVMITLFRISHTPGKQKLA